MGTAAALEARPQPYHLRRPGCIAAPGPASDSFGTRAGKRRDQGRVERTHYPFGILFGMAHGSDGSRYRKRNLRKAIIAGTSTRDRSRALMDANLRVGFIG